MLGRECGVQGGVHDKDGGLASVSARRAKGELAAGAQRSAVCDSLPCSCLLASRIGTSAHGCGDTTFSTTASAASARRGKSTSQIWVEASSVCGVVRVAEANGVRAAPPVIAMGLLWSTCHATTLTCACLGPARGVGNNVWTRWVQAGSGVKCVSFVPFA